MKTSISTIVGLAAVVLAVTSASAQEARYSTKPWLHARPLDTTPKATVVLAATEATPVAAARDYSTKPWLTPRSEFQIAVLAGGTANGSKAATRPERAANPKDYSSKPWLR